jgi:hypothetical protein
MTRGARRISSKLTGTKTGPRTRKSELLTEMVEAGHRLRTQGKSISQETMAEELQCDVRSIRKRCDSLRVPWSEIKQLCNV